MKNRYFTNGNLQDLDGVGLNLFCCVENSDGTFFPHQIQNGKSHFGFEAKEITKEEYDIWKERIAAPDMVTYFPGVFGNLGVVDKATYEAIQARRKVSAIANRRITRVQGLKALARNGVTKDAIYAAIDKLPGEKAIDARIDFDDTATWRRSSELVKAMGQSLGMTPDQLDDLFTLAATL